MTPIDADSNIALGDEEHERLMRLAIAVHVAGRARMRTVVAAVLERLPAALGDGVLGTMTASVYEGLGRDEAEVVDLATALARSVRSQSRYWSARLLSIPRARRQIDPAIVLLVQLLADESRAVREEALQQLVAIAVTSPELRERVSSVLAKRAASTDAADDDITAIQAARAVIQQR